MKHCINHNNYRDEMDNCSPSDDVCGDLMDLVLMNTEDAVNVHDIAQRIVGLVEHEKSTTTPSCHREDEANSWSDNSMQAGYMDCMDEAIRFLVEEENISPEHPIINSLRSHLQESREKVLNVAEEHSAFDIRNNNVSFVSSDTYYNQVQNGSRYHNVCLNEIWSTG